MDTGEKDWTPAERRFVIKHLIETGVHITGSVFRQLIEKFGCASPTVRTDLIYLSVNGSHKIIDNRIRKRIWKRDEGICQYCNQFISYYVLDHVIPHGYGGVTADYNLVVCCDSCNHHKKSNTWIPNNIDALTIHNPEWRAEIMNRLGRRPRHVVVSSKAEEVDRRIIKLYGTLSAAQAALLTDLDRPPGRPPGRSSTQ